MADATNHKSASADGMRAWTKGAAARGVRLAPAAAKSKAKTAVIVVHGMGEQRPLETIQGFVETVYQRDPSKARNKADPPPMLSVSVVPDSAFASSELRRLTTQDDGPEKRTDFFEFYWADLMEGTPVEMVTSWIDGLLLRSPWRVPMHIRVWLAWLLLWAMAVIVVVAGFAAAYPQVADYLGPIPGAIAWLSQQKLSIGWGMFAFGALLLGYNMIKGLAGSKAMREAMDLSLPAIVVVVGVVLLVWPTDRFPIDVHLWAAGITAGVAWFMHALVAPYLGDVVRYTRATPATVERRKLIRERGLALLEAVHAKRADSTDDWEFVKSPTSHPPAYDRIVLVAHSLGTFVAYDILQMFWEKYGPTHHQSWQPGAAGLQGALHKVDEFVQKEWVKSPAEPYELEDYLAAQRELREELHKQEPHWRITDFITLGCPLVHSEFLVTEGSVDLENGFVARRFAACPPRPDPLQKSMLYSTTPNGPKFPHFAAQFAAVKWTNICDMHWFPLLGDLISGELRPLFGNGIVEHVDRIERGWWWPFRRIVTHTEYWKWQPRYLKVGTPKHIEHLREAIDIGR